MGLDSYLYKRAKTENAKIVAVLKYGDTKVELMYWRKRYSIHEKFSFYRELGQSDNCQEIILTKDNLKEILDWATQSFEDIKLYDDKFFYDFYDFQEICDLLIKILNETDFDNEEIFYYAWY